MDGEYQRVLVSGHYAELARLIASEWNDVSGERDDLIIYLKFRGRQDRQAAEYLARIDASAYPVHPYWIGFLNPALPRAEWPIASDRDPRFWPFSLFPALQGSFNIFFAGPYRTFWCQPCTMEYFYYHGHEIWDPSRWTLPDVVAYLRAAVSRAEHPDHWRPVQRPNLVQAAVARGIQLPPEAGVGES